MTELSGTDAEIMNLAKRMTILELAHSLVSNLVCLAKAVGTEEQIDEWHGGAEVLYEEILERYEARPSDFQRTTGGYTHGELALVTAGAFSRFVAGTWGEPDRKKLRILAESIVEAVQNQGKN